MKSVFRVWENQVTGCVDKDDPEEVKAAESFNERFTELFWILPRENRYTFMKLLTDINTLIYIGDRKIFRDGFEMGQEHCCKHMMEEVK